MSESSKNLTQGGSPASAGTAGYEPFHEETREEAARSEARLQEAKQLAAETGLSLYDACVLLQTWDEVEEGS